MRAARHRGIERNGVHAVIAFRPLARRRARIGTTGVQQCLPDLPHGKEGDNRLGPNLYKVVGESEVLPDYNYSSAMKEAISSGTRNKLDRFIANPDEVIPGNNMKPYGGLTSGGDRAKIIAFLAQSR
jgi:cytochrome c